MAQFTVWGSFYCPFTTAAVKRFKEENIEIDYKEISDSMSRMREFLALRDHRDEMQPVREAGRVGVPCIITNDDKILFEVEDAIKLVKK